MKIPRYMYTAQTSIAHPGVTLRAAARAAEIEASFHRLHKNTEAAWALKNFAQDLYRAAEGESFAHAFNWPTTAQPEAAKGEK